MDKTKIQINAEVRTLVLFTSIFICDKNNKILKSGGGCVDEVYLPANLAMGCRQKYNVPVTLDKADQTADSARRTPEE